MMHAEVRAVKPQFLGGDREVYRLQKRIGSRARGVSRMVGPMPEREEAYFFHELFLVA